ncbi:hypothetical protein SLEP1_g24806 [Rubroshorea leprosula]|uniref:PB1-like domain-containing protein n=1 Tax=Rubroshorea leprosula TaxID=152421 RepID=A0AAV5JR85_9ROSI|nr:hypothetical protein SLEP1_g24806 [Rubroshorea leprosula]
MFLHVGGKLVQNNGLKYVGGECHVWNVDLEKITVWEFYRKVEFCKYDPDMVDGIWYLQLEKTLEDGLVRIVNDDSVRDVLDIIKEENDNVGDNVQSNVTEESVGIDGAATNVTEEGVGAETHDGDAVGASVESDDATFMTTLRKEFEPPTVGVKYFDAHTTASSSVGGPSTQHFDEANKIGSDEEDSYLSTSNDEGSEVEHGKRRQAMHKVYQEPRDDETLDIRLGMIFTNKQQFGDATYLAMDQPTESWMVKTFVSEHTCHWLLKKNKQCSSTVVSKYLVRHKGFTALYMRLTDIYNLIKKELSVELSQRQLKKSKEKIGKAFEGDCKMEYGKLWDYVVELQLKDLATSIIIVTSRSTTDLNPVFLRMYICFSAMKLGFIIGYRRRRVVGLDGPFCKGAFNEVLLVVVSRDANTQMFPLAWAAVEDAEHRTYARHKYANFQKNNGGKELKVAFWECVKVNIEHNFNKALTELGHIKPSAVPAIMNTHPRSKAQGIILYVRRLAGNVRTVARREYGSSKFVGMFVPKFEQKLLLPEKVAGGDTFMA